jgi:farnesyl-diphosphate farnesyltransferase
LAQNGLSPEALTQPANMDRFRPVYDSLLRQAQNHLGAGCAYIQALAWRQARVRLSCAWPILIGLRTIERLRAGNILAERIKISRAEVRHLIFFSILYYPFPSLWKRMFR